MLLFKMIKKIALFIFYSFLILLTLEILIRIFINQENIKYSADNRYMLFEENDVFKNFENFFLYYPNKKILSETYYDVNDKFIKEFSYFINTNNLGLVQNSDLNKKNESILFLGDSFTEGQGHEAWINNFNGSYKDLQIVNGGIMGTGPIQFYNVENYLSKVLRINKVVFLYIGEDFIRMPFKIPITTQNCLKNQDKCIGNENFYGFKKQSDGEISLFLEKLKTYRMQNINETFEKKIKSFLKTFHLVKLLRKISNDHKIREYFTENIEYTKKLFDKYEKDIIFIRLNTKQEILLGDKFYWTKQTEKKLQELGIESQYCSFNNDLKLFYKYDGHPNKLGYEYLYKCVLKILNDNL